MNKNIEMNEAFTLIELIRRYQLETKDFMRYSKNIVNGIVYALYKTRLNNNHDPFTISPDYPDSLRLSTKLYNYDVETDFIQDDDLDDITYESIFDFPRELLQRKIVITRKEPLINIPSTIVWYGTWFDGDIDFSSESINSEDMLSTKFVYLLADIFDDLINLYDDVDISEHEACVQYQSFNENKIEMIHSAYFLDMIAHTISTDEHIHVSYVANYMDLYKSALGHIDFETQKETDRENAAESKKPAEKTFTTEPIEGPLF